MINARQLSNMTPLLEAVLSKVAWDPAKAAEADARREERPAQVPA